MKKKLAALFMSCLMLVSPTAAFSADTLPEGGYPYASEIPAFPGAEGGGKYTSGGRGQEVYIVTTLEDYDEGEEPIPGSLRDAVSQDNRTIVFNVSGNIILKRKFDLTKRKNITIAGQTAPGDGITIYGFETNISNSENIIIRYLRFRPGAANVHKGDSMDAIWGRSMKNVMIDHLSTSWSTDETMSLYRGENMTVQWSIIAESLTMSGHTKGRHGYGAIWGGVNTTYHHNLISNHTSRNPRMGGGTPEADDNDHIANFDMRNNVLYNWGFNTIYGGGRANSNYINNYIKPGPGTRESVINRLMDAGEKNKPGQFYVNGNYMENNASITADNKSGVYVSEAAAPTTKIVDKEFEMDGTKPENLRTTSAQEAYKEVLAKAGATYPRRDALDSRIIYEVKNGKGRYANVDAEVGGLPIRTSEKRPDDFDKDKDGMADAWELENGLDPTNPDDGKALSKDGSGYTNLENYMNSLVDMENSPENPEISISAPYQNQLFTTGDTVKVTANVTDNDGIAKVEFFNGGDVVGEATKAPYTFEMKDLKDGTYFISAKATDVLGNQTQSSAIAVHVNDKSAENSDWVSSDIGAVETKGNTTIYSDDKLTVKGSGKLKGSDDKFQFAYKCLEGDGEIVAKLDSVTAVDNHAFSGLMIRENLSSNSAAAAVGLSSVKAYEWKEKDPKTGKDVAYYRNAFAIYLAGRDKSGADFNELDENLDNPENALKTGVQLKNDIAFKDFSTFLGYYMKLTRKGDVFTAYCSPDGKDWTEIGSRTIPMSEKVYVGLAVDANKVANKLVNINTAIFSNVSITGNVTKAEGAVAAPSTSTPKSVTLNPVKYNANKSFK